MPEQHVRPSSSSVEVHALDAVLALLVDLPQAIEVLLACIPEALCVGLKKGGDHVPKGVGILVQHAGPNIFIGDVGLVCVLI